MSAAALEYMLKPILKMIGVKPEDLNPSILIPQLLASQGISPEDAQQIVTKAQRILLDYEANQEQINMRLIAILTHMGIDDPVTTLKIETLEGNDNA